MRYDIEVARKLGAAGVVLGLLRPDATIDRDQTAALVELARPTERHLPQGLRPDARPPDRPSTR